MIQQDFCSFVRHIIKCLAMEIKTFSSDEIIDTFWKLNPVIKKLISWEVWL